MKKLLILLFPLLIFSCEEEKELTLLDQLQGTWMKASNFCDNSPPGSLPDSFVISGSQSSYDNENFHTFEMTNKTFQLPNGMDVYVDNLDELGLQCTFIYNNSPNYNCTMQFEKL